jgi:hypothetical protein
MPSAWHVTCSTRISRAIQLADSASSRYPFQPLSSCSRLNGWICPFADLRARRNNQRGRWKAGISLGAPNDPDMPIPEFASVEMLPIKSTQTRKFMSKLNHRSR